MRRRKTPAPKELQVGGSKPSGGSSSQTCRCSRKRQIRKLQVRGSNPCGGFLQRVHIPHTPSWYGGIPISKTTKLDDNVYHQRERLAARLDHFQDGHVHRRETECPANGLDSEARHTILRFDTKIATEDELSEHRRMFYLTWLPDAGRLLGATFLNPTREDVQQAVKAFDARDYEDWTRINFRSAIKRFYKWLLGKDEDFPECVKWLKSRKGLKVRTWQPDDLLTPAEMKKLLGATLNLRDRALINLVADSGCRIGELLTLTLGRVEINDVGLVLHVRGKTGDRRVLAIGDSLVHVTTWIDMHPLKGKRDAPLFVGLEGEAAGRGMTYAAARKMLLDVAARAGVRKRVHAHLFRHGVATDLAPKVTESVLEKQMGWTHGSQMTRTYVSLSGRDVDDAIKAAKGAAEPKVAETKRPAARPRACPRCKTVNEADASFCRHCGTALEAAAGLESLKDRDALVRALSDPEMRQGLLALIRQAARRPSRA